MGYSCSMNYNQEVIALISKRRRQILVHSILYYKYDSPSWSDWNYRTEAQELAELQTKYPEEAQMAWCPDIFRNFMFESGFYLPLDDPWGNKIANFLLKYENGIYPYDRKENLL